MRAIKRPNKFERLEQTERDIFLINGKFDRTIKCYLFVGSKNFEKLLKFRC